MTLSYGKTIVVPEAYSWVLLEVLLVGLHIWITGFAMLRIRLRLFNKDFYQKRYPQYKQLSDVMKPDAGYPDDGQGRLSEKLTDQEWFKLNNYRRAHYNYLEVC
jgi:hypothetical protein